MYIQKGIDPCGYNMLQYPLTIQSSIRFQGAIGYGDHRPPQAPEAVETVDAEQDSQGSSNSGEMATRFNYLMAKRMLDWTAKKGGLS